MQLQDNLNLKCIIMSPEQQILEDYPDYSYLEAKELDEPMPPKKHYILVNVPEGDIDK